MGFNSVYRVLQEVFPQVDSRMLRAVAIEHSKDTDAAVEVVLVEVIPGLSKQPAPVSPSRESKSLLGPSEGKEGMAEESTESTLVDDVNTIVAKKEYRHLNVDYEALNLLVEPIVPISSQLVATPETQLSDDEEVDIGSYSEATCQKDTLVIEADNLEDESTMNSVITSSGPICSTEFPLLEPIVPVSSQLVVTPETQLNDDEEVDIGTYSEATFQNDTLVIEADNFEDESTMNSVITSSGPICSTEFQLLEPIVPVSSQLVVTPETQLSDDEEVDIGSYSEATHKKDTLVIEADNLEDESTMNSVITSSGPICSTEFLEDMIEDAKNNKKTLGLAMDSVITLMREVECKEKAAEKAKEEAARGSFDIIAKIDELKQALGRAKEANDMHAGEVYAEKSILATEVKELQLRLLSLSDERDRSLSILDEMRKALETRLAASLKEIEAAEQEKLEKEGLAREELAYQESQMEKVVEESKILKREAEENTKLQDFLMDRGRAIDMLQGEISVRCQDVKLLKEKFDKRIPLSRSLSSSQTSSILASSSSSVKSFTTSPPEHELERNETQKKDAEFADSNGFLENWSSVNYNYSNGEAKQSDNLKPILDDGWELFDRRDLSWERDI